MGGGGGAPQDRGGAQEHPRKGGGWVGRRLGGDDAVAVTPQAGAPAGAPASFLASRASVAGGSRERAP